MSEDIDRLPVPRTRRRGQRMTAKERKDAQEKFLKAMENTANVRAACLQAGISHTIVYQWAEHDTAFSIRFNEANKNANWLLFGEAWRRSMIGEERYYVSRGEVVLGPDGRPATYYEKSDRLLELLLKARLPEFREKQPLVEVSNVNVNTSNAQSLALNMHDATPEELRQLKEIAQSILLREGQS